MKLKNLLTLALVASIALFSSCKKDKDSAPQGYFKVKVNGNWVNFTKVAGELGPDLADASKTNFTATATSDDLKTVFDISVQVNSTSLPVGTYNSDNYYLPVNYMTNAMSVDMKSYDNYNTVNGQPTPKYILNITSITDKTVSGNFTGNLLVESLTDEYVQVTEGEFSVPRVR